MLGNVGLALKYGPMALGLIQSVIKIYEHTKEKLVERKTGAKPERIEKIDKSIKKETDDVVEALYRLVPLSVKARASREELDVFLEKLNAAVVPIVEVIEAFIPLTQPELKDAHSQDSQTT